MIQEQVPDFSSPALESVIQKVVAALQANNIDVRVVDTAEEARRFVLDLIPEGAEVHSGRSKTLQDVGLYQELFESGRYDSVRHRSTKMDRQTQGREIRKFMAAPDYMLGSVQAITEGGDLVVASASGSQLGPYANTAGRLILVVGSQKIVRDLDEALQRIEEHVFPYEDPGATTPEHGHLYGQAIDHPSGVGRRPDNGDPGPRAGRGLRARRPNCRLSRHNEVIWRPSLNTFASSSQPGSVPG
jgi:hypothetical protein